MRLTLNLVQDAVDVLYVLKKRQYLQQLYAFYLKFGTFNYTLFVTAVTLRVRVLDLLFLIRFSKFAHLYIKISATLFLKKYFSAKTNDIYITTTFNANSVANNRAFYSLFAANVLSKKKVVLATAAIKKSNLFRKYNSYKRSLLFKAFRDIKLRRNNNPILRRVRSSFNYIRCVDENILKKKKILANETTSASFKKNNRNSGYLNYANLSFFKKATRKNNNLKFSKFFHKKSALYRLNRHFNTRYYANRLMLRDIYLTERVRQHDITKYAERFKTHTRLNVHEQIQMTLFMVLISAQIFQFKEDCINYIKKNGVFVNGRICTDPNKILVVGDVIQLPVTEAIYNYFFKLDRVNSTFFAKYSSKLHRIYMSKKTRFRTRSHKTPSWVVKMAFIGWDIPKNIEVDFTILTIIVLSDARTTRDIHTNVSKYTLLYLYRTYNWRTLT